MRTRELTILICAAVVLTVSLSAASAGRESAADRRLKAILEDDELKKVTTPKMPDLPADTEALREVESLDAQIDHAGSMQHFTTVKERVKTGAATSMTSGPSNGLDTYLDNGTAYRKTLNPLLKWFEGLEKKSKSELKESKPQYCAPKNIG